MEALLERGPQNGVVCNRITPEQIRELEPHCVGLAGIHVPEAGVVDYAQVCRRLAEIIAAQGSRVVTSAKATAIRRDNAAAIVETTAGEFAAQQVVNCAGLYSDRITKLSGAKPSAMVVPFRGEFYALRPEGQYLVKGLIYPVPDPAYPFLGVHFTKRMSGMIECGPNAVLAFAREGYTNATINLRDLGETLTYPGFWRLATKYWRIGLNEMHRSFSEARLRPRAATLSARDQIRISRLGPRRRPRPNRQPRRQNGRRFRHRRNRPRRERRKRPLPRRHGLAQHRQARRRPRSATIHYVGDFSKTRTR